jgi:aerobic-type carbon monoxide dehydrogenase small subunit (CoxS/CutS family)/CO/xanthine dehydrogenase FAD-binding subunit
MLARGIRSYHRPTRKAQALELAAQGVTPLAGGTRVLAMASDIPNVMDLVALGLGRVEVHDGDLVLGAATTLQDALDSDLVHAGTAGLLPAACRAHSVSRMIRGMATLGGESVHHAHDSEVAAALLALNAVYVVERAGGERQEIPAVRFLRDPSADLAEGGLLISLFVPGAPQGAALERLAVLPSAPALLCVAVTVSLVGGRCTRARIALTGLKAGPARVTEAEARLEGTAATESDVAAAAAEIAQAPFATDGHASAGYRRAVAPVLVRRALTRALEEAGTGMATPSLRGRATPVRRLGEVPYFTSGRIELRVNGVLRHPEAEARTTLMQLLRGEGLWGVKHGCETGECGACAVLLDGRPVVSCLTLALRAHGRTVQTVEGLGGPADLHPIQQAFVDTGAIQCGYCTPAMELCARALLQEVPDPTEDEVRDALAGCLCRCTGYVKPVQAVQQAARVLRGEGA